MFFRRHELGKGNPFSRQHANARVLGKIRLVERDGG
jgi:hypothetical protein